MFIDLHEQYGGELDSVNPLLITRLRTGFGDDNGGTRIYFSGKEYIVVIETRAEIKALVKAMTRQTVMIKADNMRATATHIEDQPDKYNQRQFCGTAFCIAGHAALAAGWEMDDRTGRDLKMSKDGVRQGVEQIASAFLGLNMDQSYELFDEDWKPGGVGRSVPQQLRRYANGVDEIVE